MNCHYLGRDHARALVVAFAGRLGPVDELQSRTRPWASATFVGTRSVLSFVVAASADVGRFVADAPEIDLPLHRAFVADLTVAATPLPDDRRVRIEVEALVIDDD